ncbi:ExbD/TolR family protein [Leptolyngbya sp. NIES-2104]|uniref:ExbD/TolR family protein n=1 Tax=Leptolyngbya sp. NIES-2104 TaxID=1552121 RepID=UPI0006EC4BEF|nr:biopolymer transporter ExbD [Leptolyngbya sp. NIES-2104]GAP97205.1 biopolymer transport protein ExbD/TolR [Leptolyngbya sp. NIES-2104]
MKVNLDSPADEAQIQIVPLIDVIFCILTFFILAALQLTRQQGIGLELPQSQTSSVLMSEMLVIGIDSNGQTYLSNQGQRQLIDRSQLYQLVDSYHRQQPEGLLVLEAAQTAFYNDVVQVLDVMRAVAPDRVALSTAPGNQPGQPQQGQPQAPGTIPQITPAPNLIPSPTAPTNTLPTNPNLTPTTPVQPTTPLQPTAPQVPAPSNTVPTAPGGAVPQSP